MTPFFSNTENSSVSVKGGFPMCQHCSFGSIGITRFYLDNITIGDELGLKTFGVTGEPFQGLSRKPDAIVISIGKVVKFKTNLKQPLQSKYLRLEARGARLESAESVRASQPDNDNHCGLILCKIHFHHQ